MAEPQRAIPFSGELVAYLGSQPLTCRAAALWPTGILLYPPVQTLPSGPLRLVIKLYEIGKQVVVNGTVCQELNHGGNYAWRVEIVDPPPGVTELLGQYVASKLSAPPLQRVPTGPHLAVTRPQAVTGPHHPVVRADPLAVTGPQTPVRDPLGVTGSSPAASSPGDGYEVNLGEAPIVERARASSTAVPERPRLAGPGFYGASRGEPEQKKRPEIPLQRAAARLGIGKAKERKAEVEPSPAQKPARLGKPIPRPPPAPALKSSATEETDIELDESSGASARRDLVKDLEGYSKSPNRLQDLFRAALKDVE